MDSEDMLQSIEANPVSSTWRVSGEHDISQPNVVSHFIGKLLTHPIFNSFLFLKGWWILRNNELSVVKLQDNYIAYIFHDSTSVVFKPFGVRTFFYFHDLSCGPSYK